MTRRWFVSLFVSLALAFAVLACGKKPRDVKQPDGTKPNPVTYPTSR
ncbi:MAG: hypothetical protein VYB45_07510 [Pseudomonadota bacterium]|jgi:hypothetical protein|nr:hypothetical protein [Pseudomonadota bacterium]|tara:strand:- start:876 stop:1016 length:141 start_codon:yes stop_codon:yes gene_type:complete